MMKWRLGLDLSEENVFDIIQELFQGCKKELNINAHEKINPILIEIYNHFNVDTDSKHVLLFSDSECSRPFISTKEFKNISHTIKSPKYNIYIYE